MNPKKDLVKHNINFLEYPLWFQDDRFAIKQEGTFTWKDMDGYVFRSGYKVPVKTDAIFLLYFLLQSQRKDYVTEIVTTRYQVIKECKLSLDSKWYERLTESLNRWLRVDVAFSGKFYDGKEFQHKAFHIIDSWEIEKNTNNLRVAFSPEFLKMMKGKGFFKDVNFNEFKALRTPLSIRLYEILSKSFHHRDTWPINATLLANKIPMREKYPAHIIPKIRAALKTINKKTASTFEMEVTREGKGQAVIIFKKFSDSKPQPQDEHLDKHRDIDQGVDQNTGQNTDNSGDKDLEIVGHIIPNNPELNKLVTTLPWERQTQKVF